MTFLDRYLQSCRIRKAARFIKSTDRILDVGTGDGHLFRQLAHGQGSLGVDPDIPADSVFQSFGLRRGRFPDALGKGERFDVITLLAVVEHLPENALDSLGRICHRHLNPGGKVIVTVPSKWVDVILAVLLKIRLVDGMHLEEHHGYEPKSTPSRFPSEQFKVIHKSRFQLGMNYLFVFQLR